MVDITTYLLMFFGICPAIVGGLQFHQLTDPVTIALFIAVGAAIRTAKTMTFNNAPRPSSEESLGIIVGVGKDHAVAPMPALKLDSLHTGSFPKDDEICGRVGSISCGMALSSR